MKATSTSSKPSSTSAVTSSSSRERRVVGGGQLHRSPHPSAYKYYSKRSRRDLSSSNHPHAWLRNPFVVFSLSFLALGSLRLRVRHSPAPPTEGNLSVGQRIRNLRPHRGSNNNNNNNPVAKTVVVAEGTHTLLQKKFHQGNDEKKKDPFTAMSISKTSPSAVEYSLVEEGKLHGASGPSFQRFVAKDQSSGKPISVSQWADFASKNVAGFTDVLKKAPYAAYFFETKGATTANAGQKSFEFVLVEAPDLHRFASQTARRAAASVKSAAKEGQSTVQLLEQQVPFQDQFSSKQCSTSDMGCVFPNLGGDATLIAPKPIFTLSQRKNADAATSIAKKAHDENQFGVYSHLAAFCRGANKSQVESVLKQAAGAYAERLSKANEKAPLWFSTSGMGVAWLHFRLDSRPKYYTYKPFAKEQ